MNTDNTIDIKTLSDPPLPFAPGNAMFWDDPYISEKLLQAHLDSQSELASRNLENITMQINNLIASGLVKQGDRLLDLGCGPGLYAHRLAEAGAKVTGIDFSERSIAYAEEQARQNDLDIEYLYADFLTVDYHKEFDVAMQVYGELNTFSNDQRDDLLERIRKSLKPGGLFIFDVTTRELRKKYGLKTNWYSAQDGFWREGSHLVLQHGFDYPEQNLWLDQHVIIDDTSTAVYRNWFHDYSVEEIRLMLDNAGFTLRHVWGDLSGIPYVEPSDWIAVVAEKQ